jgi:hypothetical protein
MFSPEGKTAATLSGVSLSPHDLLVRLHQRRRQRPLLREAVLEQDLLLPECVVDDGVEGGRVEPRLGEASGTEEEKAEQGQRKAAGGERETHGISSLRSTGQRKFFAGRNPM